ncbi:acetamidase formamidase [Phlyctema vagabunda]|uniref:Acetamidase formamidase n=1 Tax=Phlyctema vagabunda TaxID=108571 RepID=A0ABR4PD09_9HELO
MKYHDISISEPHFGILELSYYLYCITHSKVSTRNLISKNPKAAGKMAHSFHQHHQHISHTEKSNIHLKWDNSLKPVITIDSGSTISLDLLDGGHNQFTATSTSSDISKYDFALGDPAVGPIFVNGASPGDVLKVEFLELSVADFGWTCIFPDFGLLSNEFLEPELKIWDLKTHREEGYAVFKEGIHIPLKPFLGVVGLAHEQDGQFSTIPPYDTGGNIDCKYITQGSTLYLPVQVEGALLSCGDGHAAQGDGEVCGTAIETSMKASIRVTVEKSKPWVKSPHYLTASETKASVSKGEYAALGIDPDLREASRKALRSLVDWLVGDKGLTRTEAYMLASVAADLKIAEAVDMPHYAVACALPLNVFVGKEYQ